MLGEVGGRWRAGNPLEFSPWALFRRASSKSREFSWSNSLLHSWAEFDKPQFSDEKRPPLSWSGRLTGFSSGGSDRRSRSKIIIPFQEKQ